MNSNLINEIDNKKKSLDTNYVGHSFHELSEEEMSNIVGGNVEPRAGVSVIVSKIVSAATKKWCVSAVTGLISYRHC